MATEIELPPVGSGDERNSNALRFKDVVLHEGEPTAGFTILLEKTCELKGAQEALARMIGVESQNISFGYEGRTLDIAKTLADNGIPDQGAMARKKKLKTEISYSLNNGAMPGDLMRSAEEAEKEEAEKTRREQQAEKLKVQRQQESDAALARLEQERKPLWSAMMYIADQETDFDDCWMLMKSSALDILRHHGGTWSALGFADFEQMETSARTGIAVWKGDLGRRGAVARGLTWAAADKISRSFCERARQVFPCRVELDEEGAEMAASVRAASQGDHWNPPLIARANSRNAGPVLKVVVSRELVIKTAVQKIIKADPAQLGSEPFQVKYEGEEGQGHGVTRNFITHTAAHLSDPRLGLLLPAPQGRKMLNPLLGLGQDFTLPPSGVKVLDDVGAASWEDLSRFLGRMLGMAVVHKAPTGIVLAPSLCKQLLGTAPAFEDLQCVPGLADDAGVGYYSALRNMLAHRAPAGFIQGQDAMVQMAAEDIDNACMASEMPSSAQQVAQSLAEHFELSPEDLLKAICKKSSAKSIKRIERQHSGVEGAGVVGSADITCANLLAFAEAMTKKALDDNLQPTLGLVVEEFRRVVPAKTLQGLTWDQLRQKISGRRLDSKSIDEWETYTKYTDCRPCDNVVKWWWEYLRELGAMQDSLKLNELFSWCTGFGAMPISWRFQVWKVAASRLPSVNTCQTVGSGAANQGDPMPTLYLPDCDSKEQLIQRLELAQTAKSLTLV